MFLTIGCAEAMTTAIDENKPVASSVVAQDQIPDQPAVQATSTKTSESELEILVKKVLDTKAPSKLKRTSIITLKEWAKAAVCPIIGLIFGTNKDLEYIRNFLLLSVFCVFDKFIRTNDPILSSLNNLEKAISKLTKDQKDKFIPIFKEKYESLLLDKINKEKDVALVICGGALSTLIDLVFIKTFEGISINPINPRGFISDIKEIYTGEGYVCRTVNYPGGIVEEVSKLENLHPFVRFGKPATLLPAAVDLYILSSNLYHNPSSEKFRALARIQKALS